MIMTKYAGTEAAPTTFLTHPPPPFAASLQRKEVCETERERERKIKVRGGQFRYLPFSLPPCKKTCRSQQEEVMSVPCW